jgi:pimeloyl-ACP methyl ester carboxylesterase
MHEELIRFDSAGTNLYGTLGTPEDSPAAGVVIIHGWSGCRMGPHRILVEAGRDLNKRGIATLRFDLRGRGESHGDPFETDLDVMFEDASNAVKELRRRLPPGAPLALLGMCSGGNVALGTLGLQPDVRAAVCWSTYPFQSQRQRGQDVKRTGHFLKQYARKAFCRETWSKLWHGRVNFRLIFGALFGHFKKTEGEQERNPRESVRDAEIVEQLGRYRGSLCFLFGGNDPEAADARNIFEEYFAEKEVQASFKEIKGANHNFYSLSWKRQAISRTGDWLAEILLES